MRAFAALSLILAGPSVGAAQSLDPKADEVIERARHSSATYTIYWRVTMSSPTIKPDYRWGATFRQGRLIRVEDLNARAVADCEELTGTRYDVSINMNSFSYGKKIAQTYCGIDSERRVRSTRWIGRKGSDFGLVDEVEVVDEDGTFNYLVTEDGAVVGVTSSERGSEFTVTATPVVFERTVPSGALFSRSSLNTSKVPKVIQSRLSRAPR